MVEWRSSMTRHWSAIVTIRACDAMKRSCSRNCGYFCRSISLCFSHLLYNFRRHEVEMSTTGFFQYQVLKYPVLRTPARHCRSLRRGLETFSQRQTLQLMFQINLISSVLKIIRNVAEWLSGFTLCGATIWPNNYLFGCWIQLLYVLTLFEKAKNTAAAVMC